MIDFIPPPALVTLFSAELVFVLVRSKDIQIIAKRKDQRAGLEQHQIDNGLVRSIVLEFFLFVPASALLILMLSPLVVGRGLAGSQASHLLDVPVYTMLGLVSYGFPFSAVRATITRIAMRTLQEFVGLLPPDSCKGSGR